MENKNIKTFAALQTAFKDKEVSGYIWMVSHKKPCIYKNKKIDFDKLEYGKPVFNKVQEAYLYIDNYSIHIKNIDGEELFFMNSYSNFSDKEKYFSKEMVFPSHITKENLKFTQIYKLKPSISGGDFKTYQPLVRLFKGFSNIKKINYGKCISTL